MVMAQKELETITMSSPKKVKRVAVSSKRQISIPKEFHEKLGIGNDIVLELHGNHIVLKPVHEKFEDFSENILQDLILEGYTGDDLITEFKYRKSQIGEAMNSLIEETKATGKRTTIKDLFEEDEEDSVSDLTSMYHSRLTEEENE